MATNNSTPLQSPVDFQSPQDDEYDNRLATVQHLINDRVVDSNISTVADIWYFLLYPVQISSSQEWPFKNIFAHQATFQPQVHTDVNQIPLQICSFLTKDLRNLAVHQRLDHAACTMLDREIKIFDDFWLSLLVGVLVAFTDCPASITRSAFSKRATIIKHIYGEQEDIRNVRNEALTVNKSQQTINKDQNPDLTVSSKEPKEMSAIDLNKSIQVMMQIVPPSERLSGAENEPFMSRLNPILEQMGASKVSEEHQPTVLFSLTKPGSKARKVLKRCNLNEVSITQMVTLLKEECLYDTNIQDRRATRWNNITYDTFRAKYSTEDEATRECIEQVTVFHKDLPKHLNNDAQLRDRLQAIFKPISWCSTLFERSISQYTPEGFASHIITAAANADERKALKPGSLGINLVQPQSTHEKLVAFFAKTPPPHQSRRPIPYRRYNAHQPNRRVNGYQGNRQYPRPQFSTPGNRRCFGCRQHGHILRNCPQKQRFMNRFTHYVNVGEAAKMILESAEADNPSSDLDAVSSFIVESENVHDEGNNDYQEFEDWMCLVLEQLDLYDHPFAEIVPETSTVDTHMSTLDTSRHSAYFLNLSIPELQRLQNEIAHTITSMKNISTFMLVDTGAPKSICSEDWLSKANWQPIIIQKLPQKSKPFRFAGHPVAPKYIACLLCKLKDINGNFHLFRQSVYVLPSLPIPFLLGLQVQRSLGFDICLRVEKGSHIKIQKWNTTIPMHVSSHLWLEFEPVNFDPDPLYNWSALLSESVQESVAETNLCYLITPNEETNESIQRSGMFYPIPPWQKDEWTSGLDVKDITRLHTSLRHPEPTALLQLIRQQRDQRKLPKALKDRINSHKCRDCEENAQLPRVPKMSIPPPAMPNIAVTLDVMHHDINDKPISILVMLDAGDMMIRLKHIQNDSARTAFSAYFSRWISIFDTPVYTIVDRERNLTNEFMKSQLRIIQSQLCPIPTEAPWSIGNNERSHGFIHRVLDKLQKGSTLNCTDDIDVILGEAEMAWNFVQHNQTHIPHYNRFGIMPRTLGETDSCPSIRSRIALMELAREHTDKIRAEHVILRALNRRYRHVSDLKLFTINDKVWFHRSRFGWRKGTVVKVERPTIHVQFENKTYPTHENRVRPFFGNVSLPPDLKNDDPQSHGTMDKPDDLTNLNEQQPPENSNPELGTTNRPTAISELINGTFLVSNPVEDNNASTIVTDDNAILLNTGPTTRGVIDSTEVFHTEIQHVPKLNSLNTVDQEAFRKAMKEEIEFLLKNTVDVIQDSDRNQDCEVQPLKWVLNIKRSPTSETPVRHRARLVSASHRTELRNSVHGNTPTVGLHTIRIVMSLFPTWFKKAKQEGKQLTLFTRDITKAFLQSMPSKRLIYYHPPVQFYEDYPSYKGKIWKGNTQLYGDVEAGLYWNRTFVPWLCNNIANLAQSVYDPSLLYSSSRPIVMMLCTDDTASIMDKDAMNEESKITERFICTERQYPTMDFKGIDTIQNNESIALSQKPYAEKMELKPLPLRNYTKDEQSRQLTSEELKILRSDSGRLAWLATGTSPLSAFHASVSLQSGKETPRTAKSMIDARKAVIYIRDRSLSTLEYKGLHNASIHIRLYTDGAFQNLATKHSQIGFVVMLSDKKDVSNIIHWHSARAPRRPNSTEESEMMALDCGIKCIRNMRKIVFQLLNREIPVVCYIDNQTLWMNLMNITAHSLPEIAYRCREAIYDEVLNSVCLIEGKHNPSDAMTKQKDNNALLTTISTNICKTDPTRVFMLQTSKYRDTKFIPTCQVPMN